jgi:hypothetical protein
METKKLKMSELKEVITKLIKEEFSQYMDSGTDDYGDGMSDDEYLGSVDYFVETYHNGQFAQLKELLNNFRREDRMVELLSHLNELGANEIKDWIIVNV